jgi:hypothetical protein
MSKFFPEAFQTAMFGFCVGFVIYLLGFHTIGLVFGAAGLVWLVVSMAGFAFLAVRAVVRALIAE